MKAIAISAIDGPEVLEPGEQPEPKAKKGEVKIKVRAFGLNRAEIYYRSGNMGTTEIGRIPGIEAVGETGYRPVRHFQPGAKSRHRYGWNDVGPGRELHRICHRPVRQCIGH